MCSVYDLMIFVSYVFVELRIEMVGSKVTGRRGQVDPIDFFSLTFIRTENCADCVEVNRSRGEIRHKDHA